MTDTIISRRNLLSLMAVGTASTLASCASSGPSTRGYSIIYRDGDTQVMNPSVAGNSELDVMYGQIADGGFVIPAVPYQQIPPRFYRQRVQNTTGQPAGTVVVDTKSRFLYLTEAGGTAMRYGVGIGREGFAWQGEGVIQWRQRWPKWTPPQEMIARQPELAKYSAANGSMGPSLKNPLGARALYIFQNGQDTLYRLHGSPEWSSIGKAVSSGCVRLMNQDIIDLFDRVPEKARVVVWQ